MVVEVSVRDGNVVSGMGDVKETVQVVLTRAEVTREVEVVNPNVGRLVQANRIAVVGVYLRDLQVAEDDVADLSDVESDAGDGYQDVSVRIMASNESLLLVRV